MNRPSLGLFYEQNKSHFLQIAYKVTGGNQAMAEDALHNAFLVIIKYWNQLAQLPSHNRVSRCAIIVKNKAIDLLREAKRKGYSELNDGLYCSDSADVSAIIASRTGHEMLLKCISKLPEKYRTVFELRFVKGLSNNEIANLLGITTGAVSTRLYRARLMLQDILGNEASVCKDYID